MDATVSQTSAQCPTSTVGHSELCAEQVAPITYGSSEMNAWQARYDRFVADLEAAWDEQIRRMQRADYFVEINRRHEENIRTIQETGILRLT